MSLVGILLLLHGEPMWDFIDALWLARDELLDFALWVMIVSSVHAWVMFKDSWWVVWSHICAHHSWTHCHLIERGLCCFRRPIISPEDWFRLLIVCRGYWLMLAHEWLVANSSCWWPWWWSDSSRSAKVIWIDLNIRQRGSSFESLLQLWSLSEEQTIFLTIAKWLVVGIPRPHGHVQLHVPTLTCRHHFLLRSSHDTIVMRCMHAHWQRWYYTQASWSHRVIKFTSISRLVEMSTTLRFEPTMQVLRSFRNTLSRGIVTLIW